MTLGLLAVILLIIATMAFTGRGQVPWSQEMERLHAGSRERASWMAPEAVVQRVQQHYLETMRWLPESISHSWSQQWQSASHYLSGSYLQRHQEILKLYRTGKPPRYSGILRCTHHIEVCEFSDDGERCLVIDRRSSCRMATYDYWTQDRVSTQDMGDSVLVYAMVYDRNAERWKLDQFIQELPSSWRVGKQSRHLRLLKAMPPSIGRDN